MPRAYYALPNHRRSSLQLLFSKQYLQSPVDTVYQFSCTKMSISRNLSSNKETSISSINRDADEDLWSKVISFVRFPLTVGIVFIHFNVAYTFHSSAERPFYFFYIIDLCSKVLPSIGVPMFFIISGYLFFYRNIFDTSTYRKKLYKRCYTLLMPFFLWNIIAIGFHLVDMIYLSSDHIHINITIPRIINTFFNNSGNRGIFINDHVTNFNEIGFPINVPLWYIRDLFIMVVFSPVTYWIIKKTGIFFIIVLFPIWFNGPSILPPGIPMLVTALFFFSVGALFSIRKINPIYILHKLSYIPLLWILFITLDLIYHLNWYIHRTCMIIGICSFFVIALLFVERMKMKPCYHIANSCFFIYLFHTLIIKYVGNLFITFFMIKNNDSLPILIIYFIVPLVTISICFFTYSFLKNYLPNLCKILTGNR